MRNFAIFTDSCCDLPDQLVQQHHITVLPLGFTIKGDTFHNYSDHRDMSLEEFYTRLRNGEMATTSAVNVGQYHEAMEEGLLQGQDILVLSFSSALSTSCQSAQIAAQELGEKYPNRKIFVVDTLNVSMGQGLLVYLASKKMEAGETIEAVRDWAEATKGSIANQFTVDELGFLKRGGRISATTAVVGTMLAVKPLLHVDREGKLVSVGKARGRKSAITSLVNTLVDCALEEMDTIFISHGDCLEEAEELAEKIRTHFPHAHIQIAPIGPVIGSHAGPGTLAVFFLGNR